MGGVRAGAGREAARPDEGSERRGNLSLRDLRRHRRHCDLHQCHRPRLAARQGGNPAGELEGFLGPALCRPTRRLCDPRKLTGPGAVHDGWSPLRQRLQGPRCLVQGDGADAAGAPVRLHRRYRERHAFRRTLSHGAARYRRLSQPGQGARRVLHAERGRHLARTSAVGDQGHADVRAGA